MTFLAVVLASVWAVCLLPGPAAAHTLDTQGFSEIAQQGDDVRYELVVDYAAFATVAGVGEPGDISTDDAERELKRGQDEAAEYLDRHLQVLVDGVVCDAVVEDTGVEQRFEQPYARVSVLFDCPGTGEYEIRYSVLVGDLDPGHGNVASYHLAGQTGEFVFDAEHRELLVGEASLVRQVYRFAALGFHHILGGLDHVLFVVALLIGARGLREVLGVVTAFTLAHSATLVLAAIDVLTVPSSVVEPLIALSIAYVAAANALGRPGARYQLPVVFGFGLLHGMGFAGALQFSGDLDWSAVSSLVSFNVGIELGQALMVALLLPMFLFVRTFTWSRYVHFGATGVITTVGVVWFVERLVLA
ncbi:HupE/UreJ family protein [Actinopolymorpha sp. B17G11]|uniref:HupE/UreJ family protein n=1 Tax=Actinopolymorpha sp. B17G11 TaxID=3160861 RepID=UPI0032E3C282